MVLGKSEECYVISIIKRFNLGWRDKKSFFVEFFVVDVNNEKEISEK